MAGKREAVRHSLFRAIAFFSPLILSKRLPIQTQPSHKRFPFPFSPFRQTRILIPPPPPGRRVGNLPAPFAKVPPSPLLRCGLGVLIGRLPVSVALFLPLSPGRLRARPRLSCRHFSLVMTDPFVVFLKRPHSRRILLFLSSLGELLVSAGLLEENTVLARNEVPSPFQIDSALYIFPGR